MSFCLTCPQAAADGLLAQYLVLLVGVCYRQADNVKAAKVWLLIGHGSIGSGINGVSALPQLTSCTICSPIRENSRPS